MEETQTVKKKIRLIVRLGSFLITHSILVSILCCTAGYIMLLLLPILAKNTYISENALMPGSANPLFSVQDTQVANKLVKDIMELQSGSRNGLKILRLLAQNMADVGAEVYYHKVHPQRNQFHPLNFFFSNTDTSFMTGNKSCTSEGISVAGIIRAPQGEGKESIVLVTPYNLNSIELNEAMTLGLAFSIFSLLSQVTWLAKDVIWLAADTQHGEYNSVAAWLREYHDPTFSYAPWKVNISACAENTIPGDWEESINELGTNTFRRAGTMAAALIFRVNDREEGNEVDSLTIRAEASNGQMPNLDLVNIVHYIAVHRQALRVRVGTFSSLHSSAGLKLLGNILELLSNIAGNLNPQWKFGIPTSDYVEGTATLANSIFSQALGVPTGSHGAFRDYQIDAVTLEVSPKFPLTFEYGHSTILLKSGRLIEGVVRSVNNLLEKFHQSFFLYLLTAPSKFVSVGVYMIAFALLAAPLPIVAAALFVGKYKNGPLVFSQNNIQSSGAGVETAAANKWKWLHAARVVFTVHLWAIVVSMLPYGMAHFPNLTSESSMLIWVSFSIITLLIFYYLSDSFHLNSYPGEWITLKAVMISVLSIGLSLMSIINFSAAQIGAMLLVPMSLFVHPLKQHQGVLLSVCNLFLGFVGFPPSVLLISEALANPSRNISIGCFWDKMESLWAWNSATYLCLLLVHLPCWVLCIHILLHR